MNELVGLLVLSVIVNIVLIWFCKNYIKQNNDLINFNFEFMDEIVVLRKKIKKLEEK